MVNGGKYGRFKRTGAGDVRLGGLRIPVRTESFCISCVCPVVLPGFLGDVRFGIFFVLLAPGLSAG